MRADSPKRESPAALLPQRGAGIGKSEDREVKNTKSSKIEGER
jgi:hypothetical protein